MKYYFQKARRTLRLLPVVLLFGLFAQPLAAGELRLLMFERPGCIWCARWEREIGPVYPKTTEAAAAPLTRIDISDPLPEGVELARPTQLTPTFVLLEDGQEVGRIEGYPGQDFFWPMLDELLARAS